MVQVNAFLEIMLERDILQVCQYLGLACESLRPLCIQSERVLIQLCDDIVNTWPKRMCGGTNLGGYVAADIWVCILSPGTSKAV